MTSNTVASPRDEEEAKVERINRELRRNLILETALIAFGLGALTVISVFLSIYGWRHDRDDLLALGLYILVVHIVFHVSEFAVAAWLRPHDTHPDAFMVFHSGMYLIASSTALLEFVVEMYVLPEEWKPRRSWLGPLSVLLRINRAATLFFSALTLMFYSIRVIAMIQCGPNFSLLIEEHRRANHQLVTHGVYRYLRHPSYLGWFWRTVCAQWVLANPVSAVAHTFVTWYFFRQRIAYEEGVLERQDFFGERYTQYKARTIVGIIGI